MQAIPDEDHLPETRQIFPELLTEIVQAVGRAGDEAKLGPPMPLLVSPGRQGQGRCSGHLGEKMRRGDDRGMEAVPLFEDQIPHPVGIGQVSRRQDIPDDPDRLIHVPVEGLHGEKHLLPVLLTVGGQAGGKIGPQSAGSQGDPFRHRLVRETGRPHLDGEFTQERQVGLQLLGDV